MQLGTKQANANAFNLKSLHLGFIKFWLIGSNTNMGYTLWWDRGTLLEMYIQDRVHQPDDNVIFQMTQMAMAILG